MILSVVIVSYNVKYFLEQCLSSVKKAVDAISFAGALTEVFIIDNASSDGSVNFLEPLYPDFHFIRNPENSGFAKANNLALPQCHGEFILFLNPDTILAEDSLQICIDFLRGRSNAGAVGVRMVDGAGRFLRESKRGFPYPVASFFKMIGLAQLFPRSGLFSSYYMGHLPDDQIQEIEVLSGAFMMVRKTVLDQTGGFDEQFFMYAEDIDLSYRMNKTGFKNFYLPDATIIHFKGESTQKDFRYVKMFYSAMQLFMKKHFNDKGALLHLYILTVGLRLRQTLTFISLPFKNSEYGSKKNIPVFIRASGTKDKNLEQKLEGFQMQLSETEENAKAFIFFETGSFAWKMIIAEIRNNPGRRMYYFKGAGTHAIVGSNAAGKQGKVIVL